MPPCGRTTGMRAVPAMSGREKMGIQQDTRFVMDHLVPAMGAPSGIREIRGMGPGRSRGTGLAAIVVGAQTEGVLESDDIIMIRTFDN